MSTTTKGTHTPGPWDAETACDTGELVPIENSGQVLVVMAASGDVAYIANALDPAEVQNANARLIAASPDLLAACKDALSQIDYLRRRLSDKERRFVAPTTNKCEESLSAAIRAAEGGAL